MFDIFSSSRKTDRPAPQDSFRQQIADLAAGQEQIVIRMQSVLNITLADLEAARSLHERPTNPDAFDLILRARAIPQVSNENIASARWLSTNNKTYVLESTTC